MKLVIAEKPSVASSIADVLGAVKSCKGFREGNGYIVSWCVGHLIEFATPENYNASLSNWSIDTLPIIPERWKFAVKKQTSEQYKLLKNLLNRDDIEYVICATDAGREGECIFRYVYMLSRCKKPVKRLWISSVEENEILNGFQNLKNDSDYDRLYYAGFARSKADWLVGMNATRLFSCAYNARLTIGRVQTPTLNLIVKREEEIKNFIPEKYYTVIIDCGNFKAESDKIKDISQAKSIAESTNNTIAFIKSIEKTIKKVNPPKLFNLADLQKAANRLLDYTAQQTLNIAQELYEKKLITYPRTDSNYVNESMSEKLKSLCKLSVDFMKATDYSPNVSPVMNDKEVTDHHALLPTVNISNKKTVESLLSSERKLLQLICSQLIYATSDVHSYEQTLITLLCSNVAFKANGNKIISDGWKAAQSACLEQITEKKQEIKDTIFPSDIAEGLVIENVKSAVSDHKTTPPKHYTDASLISAMERAGNDDYEDDTVEKKGIGTQATQAGIIEKIIKSEYVKRSGKNLVPTEKGINLIKTVPDEIKSPKLTALWESKLQAVEKGAFEASEFMKEIERFATELVNTYSNPDNLNQDLNFERINAVIGKCPKCGKDVITTPKAYSCCGGKDGCGFLIWKTIAGKNITEKIAAKLLKDKKTNKLKGFKKKDDTKFDAKLTFDSEYKVKFTFK